MARDTVGKISSQLIQKEPESRDPIEIQRELQKDFIANINECILRGKKDFFKDFFIVVITKKEPLMPNVLRNYFTTRSSCPTPDYDQTVYRFKRSIDLIEFLWVIPSKDTCLLLKENALEVAPEERDLLRYVLEFSNGTLFKLAKKLNGEKSDSPLLEK